MSRRANVPGILIISAIYWGALLYWKWDSLFPDRPVDTTTGVRAVPHCTPRVKNSQKRELDCNLTGCTLRR